MDTLSTPSPAIASKTLISFITAFTLAEVLIVLGIIGLIADMTIPTLLNKIESQTNVAALKKAYSTLSQATLFATTENGSVTNWDLIDYDMDSTTQLYNYYKPYLKILRECQNKEGCWAYPTLYLNKGVYNSNHNSNANSYYFTTADGMNFIIDIAPPQGIYTDLTVENVGLTVTYTIVSDVNGNKGPNQLGKDIFMFYMTNKGLKPLGVIDDSDDCKINKQGFTCAAKVIMEGRINY